MWGSWEAAEVGCMGDGTLAEVRVAERDRSQGFGFMYVDITKLLKERKENASNEATDEKPVLTNNVKHANFNRDTVAPKTTAEISALTANQKEDAIRQVRANLDRLQVLHHKLHSMLDDLNKTTDSKKKS